MHVFGQHLAEQIDQHPNLYNFNLEGLEKYHSTSKTYFHRATNKDLEKRLTQIFTKRIRVEDYLLPKIFAENYQRFMRKTYILDTIENTSEDR